MSAPATHTLADRDPIPPYYRESDWSACPRCGVWRRTRRDRNTTACRDCSTVETQIRNMRPPEPLAGGTWRRRAGVWRWEETDRMTADDWEWCRAQETTWFWQQWERENRAGTGERLVAEARRRVA